MSKRVAERAVEWRRAIGIIRELGADDGSQFIREGEGWAGAMLDSAHGLPVSGYALPSPEETAVWQQTAEGLIAATREAGRGQGDVKVHPKPPRAEAPSAPPSHFVKEPSVPETNFAQAFGVIGGVLTGGPIIYYVYNLGLELPGWMGFLKAFPFPVLFIGLTVVICAVPWWFAGSYIHKAFFRKP